MPVSDYRCIVLKWRVGCRGAFSLTREHGRFEVKHVSHPIVVIDAAHDVRELGELITAAD